MTKKRVLALLLTLVMLLGMLPMSVLADNGTDTYANSSVPLKLTVSSYGAPFINGSTGEHTVKTYTANKNIQRSAVGSDNASGSATARFVGSNETGWTLVIDVVIGNYSETWTTNARITNKDMSAATGSVTFGLSFNTAGGTSTYISISGGKDLPHTDHTWRWDDNHDGTHTGHCTYPGCNATKDENEKHIPGDDGFCTKCGACTHEKDKDGYCTVDDCQHIKDNKGCCKKPETPEPVVPPQPSAEDFDTTNLVTVDCTTNEEHPDKTYDLIEVSFRIGEKTEKEGQYICPVTVTADEYVKAYVGTYGEHTLSGDSEKTFDLIWDADDEKWKPEGGVTFTVVCESEPEIPDAPTWKELSGSVKVVCINPTTDEDNCCDWDVSVKSALATEGKYTMTKVDDFTYTVTLSASFYAGQYGGNRGLNAEKVAHDLYSEETLNWTAVYADGKWTMTPDAEGEDDVVLVTHAPEKWKEVGKMGKDAEGKSTGIKATCTTGSYGPITYGLTTAFVYADTDVISVEYQGEGRYLATFRTDKYVESIGKGCNDHFEDTRSHKLTSGNEMVQWYLSVGEKDETTGKYSWYSEPKTEADGAITVAHAWRVTFHPENGEDAFVVEAYDGETVARPENPSRDGYTFKGWYTAGNEKYEFTEAVTGDFDLYAEWETETYRLTIRYIYADGSQAAESKVLDLVPGENYLVKSPRIAGYKADRTVVEGEMPDHAVTETVVYRRVYNPGGSTVIPTPSKKELKFSSADHFAYVNGYPDGTVKPTGNVTRAEVAAILYRIMDADCAKAYYDTASSYRDVARGDWFNVYIATLENAGVIVDTRAGGYFRPNEAITRAELAAMLAQFSQTKGAANYFNDVPANHWAANAIAVCAKLGWINGYPDGSFRPDQTVTRAEMMAMINRALERTPKSAADLLAGMKVWSDNANVNAWYYIDVQEATNGHTYTRSGTRETWTKLAN